MKTILTTTAVLLGTIAFTQSFTELCSSQTMNGTMVNAEIYQDSVYGTGFFTQICGHSTNYLAKWDNGSWTAKEIGLTDPGHALRNIDDTLYIARYEESIDSNWLYYYDGVSLNKFGEGVYLTTASDFSELPHIYDVAKYNGNIVVCGEFDKVGSQDISGIMMWGGNQWLDIAGGLTGNISNTASVIYPHQLMVYNGNLYVVGNFRYAGGVEVNGIAVWDGMQWSGMGDGFNNTVYGIAVYNNEIYAGGSFTQSGSNTLNRLAKWDGSEWVSPGFGFIPETGNDFIFVHTLEEIDNELYIAGGLKNIEYADLSTELCGGIISYNGSSVNTFNGGVPNNDIEAVIKTPQDTLLIGGGVFGNGYVGIIGETSSIHEIEAQKLVNVYPNPSNGFLTVSMPAITDFSIAIENALGELVYIEQIKGNENHSLELDLPSGVYYLRVKGGELEEVQMVVLE